MHVCSMMNQGEDEPKTDYPTIDNFTQSRGRQTPNGILGALNAANFGYASRSKNNKAIYAKDS